MIKLNDICLVCEKGTYRAAKKDLSIETEDGFNIHVPEVGVLRCDACGEEVVPSHSHRYVDSYVADAGQQLSPGDVRALFGNIGDTQSAICEDLGLGTKTLGRWLAGTQHPNRAMGFYLRAMAEFPQVYQWVKARGWKVAPKQTNIQGIGVEAGTRCGAFTYTDLSPDPAVQTTVTKLCNFADAFRNTTFGHPTVQ